MKISHLLLILLAFCLPAKAQQTSRPQLLPQPASMAWGEGSYQLPSSPTIGVNDEDLKGVVSLFADELKALTGTAPRIAKQGDISISKDTSLKAEAYRLEVNSKGITLQAADARGIFYGLQTLRQLLPEQAPWAIPAVTIADEPRFPYRGLMLDVARFFTPKEHVLKLIDCMAMMKLNKLHLHLTDDNGWRIEIKRYPLLTKTGSRRVARPGKYFPDRENPIKGEPTVERGFFTQKDIKEMVRYAQERQIEIIPEIDLPAHSNAALTAYPEMRCPVVKEFPAVIPGMGGDRAKIIFCAGNDSVYSFLNNILDEVMELFPSQYVHIGGDEANKYYWKLCPLCQARMKQEGITDEEDLQGYFMERLAKHIRAKGHKLMGWDELTNSKLSPTDAVIFGWRGLGNAGAAAAKRGNPVVMTPARKLYLIRYQGPQRFEPVTYFGNNTLEDAYKYEPIGNDWTEDMARKVIGIQGSLWTEFCKTPRDVDYLIFPRLCAVAEGAWTKKELKDWPHFLKALDQFTPRLEEKGIAYSRSMFNIQQKVEPKNGALELSMECIRPDVEIRYTLDGTAPTASSALYSGPVMIKSDATVSAATFMNGEQKGQLLSFPIKWNKATARQVRADKASLPYVLVNGVRGSMKYSDSEWASWNPTDTCLFTVDLQKVQQLSEVSLGLINN